MVEKSNKRYNIANKVYSIVFTAAQKNKCAKNTAIDDVNCSELSGKICC